MSKKLTRSAKSVAHHSPGRTRIKVPKGHRAQLHKIKDALVKQPGVQSVEVNHDTGSVIVKHEHDSQIFEVFHKAIEAVGGDVLTTLIEGETAAELIGPVGLAAAAFGILEGLGGAIFSSSSETGGGIGKLMGEQRPDWRTLVPVGLLAAAAYKAYETRMFWQGVTPAVLCYWAFDTYWKFNVQETKQDQKNGQVLQHAEHQ
jgi:hypothetical protein